MKLSTKIILPIILISALLILLTGCTGTGTVPDESPGYTPGTITGIIAAPCCDKYSAEYADGDTTSPELWCLYCQDKETWMLKAGIKVILTYGEDEVATTTTNSKGEFTFTNVSPGKNYVVTAYCPDSIDNSPLVKDVALKLVVGGSFDTKITDLVSTSLGLVVDFLVEYSELGPEDIELDKVIAAKPEFKGFPKFKKLVNETQRVLESNCGNVNTDLYLQDALCLAAEEVGRIVDPGLVIGCFTGFTPVVAYTLTATANPSAGGTVTGDGIYSSGTTANVSATANPGYQFTDWTGDTVANPNLASTTILMNSNKTVTANFEENADVTINYEATTGGSVAPTSETLAPVTDDAAGSTAAADSGYSFVNWTDSGSNPVSSSLHFTPAKVGGLNVAATYTANFEENADVTINYEATTGGSVAPTSETLAPVTDDAAGSTATTDPNYSFVNWTDEYDAVVGTDLLFVPDRVLGLNVAATYTANFELNPCCDLDEKLTVNSIKWRKDPSDSIWKAYTDCKVINNTCGYWLTVEAELINSSGVVVDVDATNVSHGQKFTAKSTLSSGLGGGTAPTGYSVRISFYDRDGLCEPYVQELDVPYSI